MADDAPVVPGPLPEMARSLRTFGQPVNATTDAAHAAVLVPLLDARARASGSEGREILEALRGTALAARIEAAVRAAAAVGEADPARARARIAAARELLEPMRQELSRLDALAPEAEREGTTSAAWSRWVSQLRQVFAAADVACGGLARLLAEGAGDAPRRRWFARRGEARR